MDGTLLEPELWNGTVVPTGEKVNFRKDIRMCTYMSTKFIVTVVLFLSVRGLQLMSAVVYYTVSEIKFVIHSKFHNFLFKLQELILNL